MQGQSPDLKNAVPQSRQLNERQVANNAGGFTFQVRCTSTLVLRMLFVDLATPA